VVFDVKVVVPETDIAMQTYSTIAINCQNEILALNRQAALILSSFGET